MAVVNLKNYLRNVYANLKNYVDGLSDRQRDQFIRKCHKLFDLGEGDYDEENLVAFYVMKYARAYGFQFSRAYADIFADMGQRDSVRAVSIGCGTGIDYWGMSHAARCLQTALDCHLDYTGIDPQDWFYKVTDSPDMPDQDTVRYNEVQRLSDGHTEACNDFGDLLDIMERNSDEPLDDIYFFGHSIKEVSIYTVPETQEKQRKFMRHHGVSYSYYIYKYNPYLSMARFARLIRERISDRPVYVAFTYRKCPDENRPADFENTEAYDVRYGTYFATCLKQRGLNVDLVEPIHIDPRYGISLRSRENTYSCRESYFDYDDIHSYTGAPDEGDIIWHLGKDRAGAFDSLYYGRDNPAICSKREWDTTFCDADGHTQNTMDSVKNMCYQVFRITAYDVQGGRDNDMDEYNKKLNILEERLKTYKVSFRYSASPLDLFATILNERLANTDLYNSISHTSLLDHLIDDGYVGVAQDEDADESVVYEERPKGKNSGVYVKDDNRVYVKPYAQQNIIANIICGRYIDGGNRT